MKLDQELIAASGYFDPQYYSRTYPDVALLGMDPLQHFLWIGYRLQRNPSSRFNTKAYLKLNPHPKGNPLVHFLQSSGNNYHLATSQPEEKKGQNRGPIIFISGEGLNQPGFVYRVEQWAKAFSMLGCQVNVESHSSMSSRLSQIESASLIFVWRAKIEDVADIYGIAKSHGVPIVYDLDDLMVRPELATSKYIDAIRFNKLEPQKVREHFTSVSQAMKAADFCTASTPELAWHMRLASHGMPTFVLPNGFSKATYLSSRAAARENLRRSRGVVRIGYASGTRTHQADFKVCVGPVAEVLRAHSDCRLVLFRRDSTGTLDPNEFPELDGLEDRIEWRNFVPLENLPKEIARFDINLAPLEIGNPFCEAKSELKFFEAAICNVPTIASPTGPFKRAIRHGENGMLAATTDEWLKALTLLLDYPEERARIGDKAHRDALWEFGPTKRAEIASSVFDQLAPGRQACRAAHFINHLDKRHKEEIPRVDRSIEYESDNGQPSPVTVVIPLYNYESYIEEALQSVAQQSEVDLDLIIVDDSSTDKSGAIVKDWILQNSRQFNRVVIARHTQNSGLGHARNTGFDLADSPYVMCLDADNKLRPSCCFRLMSEMEKTGAAFAYPTIQQFGGRQSLMGTAEFLPARLVPGNYIDAMAMVAKEAWAFVGGYATQGMGGWEDYHFWCKLTDAGLLGVHVAKTLADYRVHGKSMLATTNVDTNKVKLCNALERQFSWLSILTTRDGHRTPTQY